MHSGDMQPGAIDLIVLRDEGDIRRFDEHLRSPERVEPVVALTLSEETGEPVLDPARVRAIVGPAPRIYVIPPEPLERLRGLSRVVLPAGGVRIWWPRASDRRDPDDHPLILALDDERAEDAVWEFARRFDLSRPHVRYELKLAEDIQALAEHQLSQAAARAARQTQRLREALGERDREARRAERAETRLFDLLGERRLGG